MLIEDVVDALGQRGVDLRRHRRAPARQLPGQQLVEDDAERVDVGLGPGPHRVGVQLRRHVRDVAHPDVDLPDHRLVALDHPREAEVRDLDVAVAVDQQLLGLEAAVVDPLGVGGAQRVQRLQQVLEDQIDRDVLGVVDQPTAEPLGASSVMT
jgi:hypothetical protein